VKQLIGLNQDLTGRSVVILEDIVDTGTIGLKIIQSANVKHFKIATLFFKPEAYKKIKIDYVGIRIPNIVGFGLDYDGLEEFTKYIQTKRITITTNRHDQHCFIWKTRSRKRNSSRIFEGKI
jgi:hypoxanthine-guanine phosphoribosyltransferase